MNKTLRIAALLSLAMAFCAIKGQAQSYSLPNDNAGCPATCRLISWQAGSDLWNGGTLPVYSQVTCSPLTEDGVTDDTTNIQNCINAANAGTGAYATCHAAGGCATAIPAGTVFLNGKVRLSSNTVLRGAGPTTHINLGASGALTTVNWSYSTGLNPTITFGCLSTCLPFQLSGTPHKGDTTVTISTGTVAVGNWISIAGTDDPAMITTLGLDGFCMWCGWNMGYYAMQQIVQITSFASGSGGSGTVANISRPLYFTPYTAAVTNASGQSGSNEPAGATYRIWIPATTKAGYENFNVTATSDIGAADIIQFQGCLYCWAKGLEVQNTGTSSGSAHIELDWSYGNEIRDNYLHDQRSGASGAGYGVYFQFVNSDHKVENNICRHSRHCIVYQGGGSGTAILYNYFDDMYTDDTTYLGSGRSSHGAHPFMNLFEGNLFSHEAADDFWGTTSHTVFFRNWLWGDETENFAGAIAPTGTPSNGFDALDLYQGQEFYSFVGNVLGHIGLHTTWSAATLVKNCTTNNCGLDGVSTPVVYSTGTSRLTSLTGRLMNVSATSLSFGNVDVGQSRTLNVTFTNSGSMSVTIAEITVSGAAFSASGLSVGQVLTSGQTATLSTTFTPTAGSLTGSVTVTSNASNSPLTISFSGTGVNPGNSFFVDSVGGLDTNPGTQAQPWQTLGKVNATTFNPGDQLFFKAGDMWSGQVHPLGSGTAASPIIVDMYGTGPKPIIVGGGLIGTGVVYLNNQQYWEWNNLEVTNDAASGGDRRAVYFSASNFGVVHHLWVNNFFIHNVKGSVGSADSDKRTGGMLVETVDDSTLATRFDDIRLTNSTLTTVDDTGFLTNNLISVLDYPGTTAWLNREFTNVLVSGNVISDIGKNAMILRLLDGTGLIQYNLVHDTASRATTGNQIFTRSSQNVVLQYNEGYNNLETGGFDGSMYDADLQSPGCIFQYSYSHDNNSGLFWEDTVAQDANVTVRYNISQNDKALAGGIFTPDFANTSLFVYNNTIYVPATFSGRIIDDRASNTKTYSFYNNIFYVLSTSASYNFLSGSTRTFSHNTFFGQHPATEPPDSFKLTTDPLLVSPGTGGTGNLGSLGGYQLQAGSPAIDSGLNIANNGGRDFFGNPVPFNVTTDRGAYEWSTATSSSTIIRHGNWDYKTLGVAFWDGGANHTLATSMYYASKPSFLSSSYPWPLLGPEGNPTVNHNPAYDCWLAVSVGGVFTPPCTGSSVIPVAPSATMFALR